MVPEDEAVYPRLTAREFVRLSADLARLPDRDRQVQEALAVVELTADQDRTLQGFSKGMRQRAKVAAAIVGKPEVLILDEPLNGADGHKGLEGFARVKDIWSNGMVGSAVRVRLWRIARSEVPEGRRPRIEWLYGVWAEMDRWLTGMPVAETRDG